MNTQFPRHDHQYDLKLIQSINLSNQSIGWIEGQNQSNMSDSSKNYHSIDMNVLRIESENKKAADEKGSADAHRKSYHKIVDEDDHKQIEDEEQGTKKTNTSLHEYVIRLVRWGMGT